MKNNYFLEVLECFIIFICIFVLRFKCLRMNLDDVMYMSKLVFFFFEFLFGEREGGELGGINVY